MARTRWMWLGAAAALLLLGAEEPTPFEEATRRLRAREAQIKTEPDPEERAKLIDWVERAKHDLGPVDADGKPTEPKAFRRAGVLAHHEAQVQRLTARVGAGGGADLGLAARLHTHRMAAALTRVVWRMGSHPRKYRYDAFAQYLTNNAHLLDSLFDGVAARARRAETMEAGAAEVKAAASQARAAVEQMGVAATQFIENADNDRQVRAKRDAALPLFTEALASLYEADQALAALAAGRPAAQDDEAAPAAPAAAGAATASPADRAKLETVRAVAASLTDEGWAEARTLLTTYATMAENGLEVARAHAGARELLHYIHLAAEYFRELEASKSAYPEYVAAKRNWFVRELRNINQPRRRRQAYSLLRRRVGGDTMRRTLDAGPLSGEACAGLMRARVGPKPFTGPESGRKRYDIDRAIDHMVRYLVRYGGEDPEGMVSQLRPLYARLKEKFLAAATEAGKASPAVEDAYLRAYQEAATYGNDLHRLVQADEAIRAVARFAPKRAAPMYNGLAQLARTLLPMGLDDPKRTRRRIDDLVDPFRYLAGVRLPEKAHARIASRLTGGLYPRGLERFSTEVTAGIEAAAAKDPYPLERVLRARSLFALLAQRCADEADRRPTPSMRNLDAFSMADDQWDLFVKAVDVQLKAHFAKYVGARPGRSPDTRHLAVWGSVYDMIDDLRREAAAEMPDGGDDLLRLVAHLETAADTEPRDVEWYPWGVAFEAGEAAVSLAGGYHGTARWHLDELDRRAKSLNLEDDFSRAEDEAGAGAD